MDWYYAQGKEQKGPVTETEFDALVASGTITSSTLIWHEGLDRWRPRSEVVAGLGVVDETASEPASLSPEGEYSAGVEPCRECGRSFATEEMVSYADQWVCADCRTVFFQRVKEGVHGAGDLRYAGFWIRVVAKFIDSICLYALGLPAQYIASSISDPLVAGIVPMAFSLVIAVAFTVFFLGRFGATPGKMALGLKVVRADGLRISYMRAAGRHFAELVSSLILLIGYIMVAFDDEKRALHDRMCDTRVVRVK
jgi:uncharacterized RDD family membrane protein YckC